MLVVFTVVLLAGCEDITTSGYTRTTYYPVITLKGDVALSIPVGGQYTEPGFTATMGDKDATKIVKVSGTVDPTKPGVYTITYSAVNEDGFSASVSRFIGVISPAAAAMDISGAYKRNAGALGVATVKKVSGYDGLYTNNNPGGIATPDVIVVYMFHTEPTVVSAPAQPTSAGTFACTNGVYTKASPNKFAWVCINSGYGTAVRTFIQQ